MKYDVYYAKHPTFMPDPNLTATNLLETHTKVKQIEARDLEDVYVQMQGDNWSPNGEARSLIRRLGLYHTSMSVGDVAVLLNVQGDDIFYFVVEMIGFNMLPKP